MPMILPNDEMMTITLHDLENKSVEQIQSEMADIRRRAENTNLTEAMFEVSMENTIEALKKGQIKKVINRLIGSKTGKYRVKTLTGKAKREYEKIPREDRITKDDIRQGTVTVSNVGSLYRGQRGNVTLLEVVPPQVSTYCLAAVQDRAIVTTNDKGEKEIQVRQVLPICMAIDHRALDFDDIIFLTVKLLQRHEDLRTYYQRKFRYVLVDEYQDTNHSKYLLTSLLAGGYENICVVGDDDQSIYRFRGATIANILNFEKQYQGSRVIRLEQNYRSTGNILDAANSVIANNRNRKGKHLWTDKGNGEKIIIYTAQNEQDEARFVADSILDNMNSGYKESDFAVIYRMNAQSNAVENVFSRSGIKYRVYGGLKFFDRKEIKDILAYLNLINNVRDNVALTRIINEPKRSIGALTPMRCIMFIK